MPSSKKSNHWKGPNSAGSHYNNSSFKKHRRHHRHNNNNNNNNNNNTGRPNNHHPVRFQPVTQVVNAQALGPSLPSLVITYTNEHDAVVQWLTNHVITDGSRNATVQVLGLDTETKPCFTKEAAQACRGPDTLQLAKSDGTCLIVHLARMERPKATRRKPAPNYASSQDNSQQQGQDLFPGFWLLSEILSSRTIAKAGVSIEDDAIELHKNHSLDTNCRMDLSDVHYQLEHAKKKSIQTSSKDNQQSTVPPTLPSPLQHKSSAKRQREDQNNDQQAATPRGQPRGLKFLAEQHVPGLVLPKKKKLQMSNWRNELSHAQIGYAAADAFAGAAILEHIVQPKNSGNDEDIPFTLASLMDKLIADELDVHLVEEDRKQKKIERKRKQERDRKKAKKSPQKKH